MPAKLGHKLKGARRTKFLKLVRQTTNVSKSARMMGVKPSYVSRVRKSDPVFDAQIETAYEEGLDALEYEVIRRGFKGVNKPVFWQGIIVGTVKEYSDPLAMFMLKSYRPRKFRDNLPPDSGKKSGVLRMPIEVKSVDEWEKTHGANLESNT